MKEALPRAADHRVGPCFKVEDGPSQPLGRSFQVRIWPNLLFLRDGQVVSQLARPGDAQLEEAFRTLVG